MLPALTRLREAGFDRPDGQALRVFRSGSGCSVVGLPRQTLPQGGRRPGGTAGLAQVARTCGLHSRRASLGRRSVLGARGATVAPACPLPALQRHRRGMGSAASADRGGVPADHPPAIPSRRPGTLAHRVEMPVRRGACRRASACASVSPRSAAWAWSKLAVRFFPSVRPGARERLLARAASAGAARSRRCGGAAILGPDEGAEDLSGSGDALLGEQGGNDLDPCRGRRKAMTPGGATLVDWGLGGHGAWLHRTAIAARRGGGVRPAVGRGQA